MTEAYCVKCRAKQVMQNPTSVTMKNGKKATKGTCPVCGTGMYRIGG
jgi:RNase P subunit RPR2